MFKNDTKPPNITSSYIKHSVTSILHKIEENRCFCHEKHLSSSFSATAVWFSNTKESPASAARDAQKGHQPILSQFAR